MSQGDMVRCLEAGVVADLRKLWSEVMPHLPQPASDHQAEIIMHLARTEAQSVSFRARAYSHAWLMERGFPSKLPDPLRPKAERMYPVMVPGVGVSVKSTIPAVSHYIRGAMEYAVNDITDGRNEKLLSLDQAKVKQHVATARTRAIREVAGTVKSEG